MYGMEPVNCGGNIQPHEVELGFECRGKAENNAAPHDPSGVHRPKIITASAIKPRPLVMPRSNVPTDSSVRYAPARPAKAAGYDHIHIASHFDTDANRIGCAGMFTHRSRTQSPYGAEKGKLNDKTRMIARYCIGERLNKTGLINGISARGPSAKVGSLPRVVNLIT